MDVHRCRFVNYPPSTINAIAFSHTQILPSQKTAPLRLAIGRANGDIEIWNPLKGAWLQETIIRGGKDRSIDGLVWIQDPNEEVQGKTIIGRSRLFSIGYTNTVTEWDLETSTPLRSASGTHGEIWCLAAQPPVVQTASSQTIADLAPQGQNLIAGCVDGALVLYSTKDGGLELKKVFSRPSAKKAKIISVAFKDRHIVVAGCSDSTIRIYDSRNGQMLRNMTLGSAPKGGPREVIVWSVNVLQNGDIVSGDSTGELKIWDGKTCTLTQRVKGHKQDILSLALSTDGSTILSGGMDRRTVVYKKSGKKGRWNEVAHRRYHDNDVKTMASFEGEGMSVVVSGGPDATPVVVPLKQTGFENQRALSFLPQESTVQTASKKRLVMSWWDREVSIWKISKAAKDSHVDADIGQKEARKLVAKILIRGEASITSATLSEDGSLLVVSTIADVKVFHLRQLQKGEGEGLKVSKVAVPDSLATGARQVQLSPDNKWLTVVRPDSRIVVLRITTSSSAVKVHPNSMRLTRIDRKTEKIVTLGGLGSYDRTVTQLAYSSDSRILAVGDIAGYIDTFVLSGHEDLTQETSSDEESGDATPDSDDEDSSSEDDQNAANTKLVFGQRWLRNPQAQTLPKLPSTPTVLSFRPAIVSQTKLTNGKAPLATRQTPHPISHELPAGEDRLFVLTATSDIFEFEVLKGTLSPWSRRNPTALFSETFKTNRDHAKGAFWDIKQGKERVWVYSVSWLWMFDLSHDLPDPEDGAVPDQNGSIAATPGKKRKRGPERNTGAGSVIPDQELLTGISRKIHLAEQDVSSTLYDIANGDAMDVDENDEEESSSALALLRRGSKSKLKNDGFKHEWFTYKYRPILGMGIIAGGDGSAKKEQIDEGFEVVVVERPAFETDLPDRYIGDQEWEKKDFVK